VTWRIAVLRGDGIGPEVTEAALRVLGACVAFQERPALAGGAAIDAEGNPLPNETLGTCFSSDAVLAGAVGGPKWEGAGVRAEQGILRLRRKLGLWGSLRPAKFLGLPTPLREELAREADLLVVRDLSGGVYFGEPRGTTETGAFNTWRQSEEQTVRIARTAFRAARARRKKVTSVDKADVLETCRLWRRVVTEVAKEFPDVELEHRHVDAMAFEMLATPCRFDVILAENLFGDILSDELAAFVGSIGLLPSASIGDGPPLFQPVHGSAPSIAGKGIANPVGAILSAAMLLDYGLGQPATARAVEAAVQAALREERTPDIGGNATTAEFTAAVLRKLPAVMEAPKAQSEAEAYAWGV
jgi:3-isopropylmalate dehydrogenase